MSDITSWLIAEKDKPRVTPGPYVIRRKFATGTAVAQNDLVQICKIPRYHYVVNAYVYHNGTLGTSATATLQRGSTALSGATTAGGASLVSLSIPDTPNVTDGNDYLVVKAGGAAWGTSASMVVVAIFDCARPEFES